MIAAPALLRSPGSLAGALPSAVVGVFPLAAALAVARSAVVRAGRTDVRARAAALRPVGGSAVPGTAGPSSPVGRLGGVVLGRVPEAARARLDAALADSGAARRALELRLGACVLVLPVVVVAPVLALAAATALLVGAGRAVTRAGPARAAAARATLPETLELLGVAAHAGFPAGPVVAVVAPRAPPPWDAALGAVVARVQAGDRLVDAVDALVDGWGDPARPLAGVLRDAARDGTALAPGLDRIAADARELRRRHAEEAARRLPVRLLLPLVLCSLPAFALLSVVPLVADAIGDLHL